MFSFKEFSLLYTGEIVPALTLLPIIVAIRLYRVITHALKAILFYLFVAAVFNIVASIFSHSNNLPLLHIYTVVEFLFLLPFYYKLLSGKKVVLVLGILFPVWAVINSLVVQNIYGFNSYSRATEALIMTIFALMYLADVTKEEWGGRPENWANAGLLLYFSGALSQFAFSNVVSAYAPVMFKMLIWDIHATFVLIMYLLFTVAFLKCRR